MEIGFMNRITGLVIALVVGGLLIGGLLAPTVAGIQDTVGNKATVTNTGINTAPIEYWDGEAMEYEWDYVNKVLTLNDEPLTLTANQMLFGTDTFTIWTRANATARLAALGDTIDVTNSDFSAVINADGTYTLTRGSTVYEGTITWGIYQDENGSANLVQGVRSSAGYKTSTADDVIILGNLYTTGENDTYYAYRNGELTVDEQYADVSSVTISKTLIDGYTDIYTTTITVNVGEESFTPYYAVVPKEVHGHETAGPAYVMFGVIVLLGIVMLVVVAANGIRNKY